MDAKQLDALVNRLYSEWCLGQEKYLRVDTIKADLKDVIKRYTTSPEWKARVEGKDEDVAFDAVGELRDEVQDILMILQSDYVGNGRQLDRRINEMDLKIRTILEEALDLA